MYVNGKASTIYVVLRLGYGERVWACPPSSRIMGLRRGGREGCHGVVCSGLKVATISRELGPELIAVTPGIRPAWSIMAAILIPYNRDQVQTDDW